MIPTAKGGIASVAHSKIENIRIKKVYFCASEKTSGV